MSEQQQGKTRKDIEAHIIAKAWKDKAYKQELLTNPQAVLSREFGVEFPQEVKIQVLEENSTSLYFVLPMSPMAITEELSEDQLEAIAGGLLIPPSPSPKWTSKLAKPAENIYNYYTLHKYHKWLPHK